jgi:hypothetical protein
MKKLFTLSLVLYLMSGGDLMSQNATQNLVYEAGKLSTGTTITIDGLGNEAVWNSMEAKPLTMWAKGSDTQGGHGFDFKLLWSDEGIYFLGSRSDDTLALKESDLQWDGHAFDQVVLYFNPYGERDSETKPYPKWEVGKGIGDCYWGSNSTCAKLDIYDGGVTTVFNGAWMDGRFGAMDVYNPDTKTYVPNGESYNGKSPNDAWVRLEKDYGQKLVSKTNGTNFTVEAFIPFSVMVPKNMATTPTKWGFEVESIDNEWEGQGKKSILAFNNDTKNDNSWYFINNFGTLLLKDATVGVNNIYGNQENIKAFMTLNQLHVNSTVAINTINVFDLLGKNVLKMNNLGSKSVKTDISTLNSGLYIVHTSDINGRVNALKVYKK